MKTIWIIDHYSSEPKYGGISRQYDFASELGKRGYRVAVIASSYSHFTHSYFAEEDYMLSAVNENVYYVYLRTADYQGNGGLKRALNMIDFMKKVLKYRKRIERECGAPNVVTGCSVHPLAWVAAYVVAKKNKVRFCAEVRDFWPRIWTVSGDKSKYDPMVIFFGMIQKWAYRKADKIIYSMYHGDKYICDELGYDREKTHLIGQPMDCERFDGNAKRVDELPDELREFIKNDFVCSFAGYYMTYEGVYVMLEAAKILKKRNVPISMLFIGSGQEKEGMLKYVSQHKLDNVLIYDRIAKELVPVILSNSQVCMAHLEVEGHREVYKYGVSKNKVNEYLYSGACTLYGFLYKDDAVAKSGGGFMFEPYDAVDLANMIEKVYNMSEAERREIGENGRRYIRENHSAGVLVDKMLKVLFD